MRILADTHVLLWAAFEPAKLGSRAIALLEDVDNDVVFSAASILEVAIKTALATRPDFQVDADVLSSGLRSQGWSELAVTARHAAGVARLPTLHADLFDRILVAQAHAEQLVLLTRDRAVAAYPGSIELI